MAIGPFHVAVGMNNRIWYYRIGSNRQERLREQDFVGIQLFFF